MQYWLKDRPLRHTPPEDEVGATGTGLQYFQRRRGHRGRHSRPITQTAYCDHTALHTMLVMAHFQGPHHHYLGRSRVDPSIELLELVLPGLRQLLVAHPLCGKTIQKQGEVWLQDAVLKCQ